MFFGFVRQTIVCLYGVGRIILRRFAGSSFISGKTSVATTTAQLKSYRERYLIQGRRVEWESKKQKQKQSDAFASKGKHPDRMVVQVEQIGDRWS